MVVTLDLSALIRALFPRSPSLFAHRDREQRKPRATCLLYRDDCVAGSEQSAEKKRRNSEKKRLLIHFCHFLHSRFDICLANEMNWSIQSSVLLLHLFASIIENIVPLLLLRRCRFSRKCDQPAASACCAEPNRIATEPRLVCENARTGKRSENSKCSRSFVSKC